MTQPEAFASALTSQPWWGDNAFRFSPPGGVYDARQWRQAVLRHDMTRDCVAFLHYRIRESAPALYDTQARIDEQGYWFPLQTTLWALDIETPPASLFPLPQPRSRGEDGPYPWLITLDEARLDECRGPAVLVPFGVVLMRLLPVSHRPIAQVVTYWLRYRVLPVCAQSGGPTTWKELDAMLSLVAHA